MAGRFSVEAVFKAVDKVTAPVSRMQSHLGKFTNSATRGLRKINKATSVMLGGLRKAAGVAIKFGAVGLGAVGAGVGLVVREFSKIENAEAAFTPLLGGAKRAKEMVEALNSTAASTPFQFENLASATSQLLPIMNGDIQNTVKTLRMLGDTAGGNSQKLDSITRGFTKAMLKGKVDMESLNMIAEAGVPIFTELAESMGTKVNEAFFKMISAGDVATKDLTKAFEKMTSEGGVFHDGMQIASRTTSGMWSTLKDNISLTAAELGSVLAPVVKDLILKATEVAKELRVWVKANRELINEKFISFVNSARDSIISLFEKIKDLNGQHSLLERLGDIITGVSNAFQFVAKHGEMLAKITAGLIALSVAGKAVAAAIALINIASKANPFVLMLTGITALVVGLNKIIGGLEGIKKAASKVGRFFGFGNDNDEEATKANQPKMISPQERVARTIEEQRKTSTAEVTIRDETKKAKVSVGRLAENIKLIPTGSF